MIESSGVHIQTRQGNNVRIGPISIITLIVVLCMAVMAVLAASTSHATTAISDRQAHATDQLYLNELAGQEFVAGVDAVLHDARTSGVSGEAAALDVLGALDMICDQAREAADGHVACTAKVDGTRVSAEFVCDDARLLNVTITIRDDASYRIDAWRMSSVQQGAPSSGTLWLGA